MGQKTSLTDIRATQMIRLNVVPLLSYASLYLHQHGFIAHDINLNFIKLILYGSRFDYKSDSDCCTVYRSAASHR